MRRFLYRNLEGNRLLVGVAVALTLAQVFADLLTAFPLKWILDKVVNHQDPTLPVGNGLVSVFDQLGSRAGLQPAEQHTQLGVILFASTTFIALGLLTALLSYGQLFIATFVGQNLSARIRVGLFGHLQRLPLAWHSRHRVGDLVQRLTSNVADIEKLVTDGLVDLLAGILTLAGIFAIMLSFNWQFTLLSMVVVPGLFFVVLFYTKNIKAATKRAAKIGGQVGEVATEDLTAITEVKAFTLEEREARHFGGLVTSQRQAGLRAGSLQAEFTPLVLVVVAISNVTIIGVGSFVATGHAFRLGPFAIAANSLTIGTLTVYLAYLKQLYQPMRNLSKLMNVASSAGSGAERIEQVLAEPTEVVDDVVGYTGPRRLHGDITFSDVVFGYREGQPVLTGVDLRVAAGKRVALVGLSGSGKTTMAKLIPRFYDVWSGEVRIDGLDTRSYPLAVLRDNVSLVLQDSVLFEGTIRDNIAIGRPDASEAEIVEAARQAHIHETIAAMPDGYDSPVREGGKNVSGGQRQRLAIARAILRDSPILILDEPTANLDVEAESEVMHAIDTLIVGRTVLMISHRLSTLGHVDEIVVLQDGRIAEHGTYAELKRSGGIFTRLLAEQHRYNADLAEATVSDNSGDSAATVIMPIPRTVTALGNGHRRGAAS
jgi:ABC-type multidrug transport system fused ATPase/permease subunit